MKYSVKLTATYTTR